MKFFGGLIASARNALINCCQTTISYSENDIPINREMSMAINADAELWQSIKTKVIPERVPIDPPIANALAVTIKRAIPPVTGENLSPKINKFKKSKGTGLNDCPMSEVAGVLRLIIKKTRNAPAVVREPIKSKRNNWRIFGSSNCALIAINGTATKPFSRNNGPIGSYCGIPFINGRVNTVPMLIETVASVAKKRTILKELFHTSMLKGNVQ